MTGKKNPRWKMAYNETTRCWKNGAQTTFIQSVILKNYNDF